MGITAAARHLKLDLAGALIEPGRRIVLRGSNNVERVIPIDTEGRFYIDWSFTFDDRRLTPQIDYIVYSSDRGGLDLAGLWLNPSGGVASGEQPIRIGARRTSYDGAPSISPNGKWVVFETALGDPDGSAGTKLEILPLPVLP